MSIDTSTYGAARMPASVDIEMAKRAMRKISQCTAEPHFEGYLVNIGGNNTIHIPTTAYELLVEILENMSLGNSVALMPLQTELTTQQAADYLNVSRPYLVKILSEERIPYRKVGAHRRIRFEDVLRYKRQIDAERTRVLDQLAREAQDLGLGY